MSESSTPTLPTLKLKLKQPQQPLAAGASLQAPGNTTTQPAPAAVPPKLILKASLNTPRPHLADTKEHVILTLKRRSSASSSSALPDSQSSPPPPQPETPSAAGQSSSKKKKPRVDGDVVVPLADMRGVMTRILMAVRNYSDESGRNLAVLFNALPNKQLYPDYYIVIKQPTALNIMQQKINGGKYASLADLKAEMQLMVDNAKTYNAAESLIYEDANALWQVFNAEVAKVRAQYRPAEAPATVSHAKVKLTATPKSEKPDSGEFVTARDGKKVPRREVDALFKAIDDNNVKAFERGIMQLKIHPDSVGRANVDVAGGAVFDWALLHAVAFHGRAKMLDMLVGQKANMDIRDTLNESTPLMWAAYAGKVNTARRLMRNNRPDKFAKNKLGQTAMDMALNPENPEWRGVLNNEAPIVPVEKAVPAAVGPELSRKDRERRVTKVPIPEGESPGPSFHKITYGGDNSLPDTHHSRSSNIRSQVKDTTPIIRPTMPVDLNKVPKWAKLPNIKDSNQLFLAAGSKELALLLEAPPIKDIELPLANENITITLTPGLKTMRANAVTVSSKTVSLPIRFYLAIGNKGVYYSIQVFQNRSPLQPVLLSGGGGGIVNGSPVNEDDSEPTVVEVTATLNDGVNLFDVIVFLCRKTELKGAAKDAKEAKEAREAAAAAVAAGEDEAVAAAAASATGDKVFEEFVGIQKKGHHAFQKALLIVNKA
ncbi:hypothetical protein HDU82_002374 [Entophlyctis luteolus]|nr:hypothetical protein HDU82_002374 [Entophlyctis luteolus]